MSGFLNSLRNLASGAPAGGGSTKHQGQDTRIRFSVMPSPGDSGFTQWHDAMKMVARLPGGIPPEFRRRLWLTVAEKHLQSRGVDWGHAERFCFNEWSNPDDDELGVQIVKDLHRTGCSLFCGAAAEENQALLKRVLLAYARWNKAVGYCQGFNMLAALILQVMDRSETDSVKVMIYLIEGVLPESYFANNLRGLSVDMAVFRDLLRLRMPTLSRHLEQLQHDARDSATGTSYEPPLTNVFTMQWFLTLFSNCLPQPTVLRVWDLIFLEGNEVLLRTALAIWDGLADRIMAVDSADEFYSIMGVLTREMLEFGLMDTNNLIKTIVTIAPFPFPELPELRDKYLYNITPWTQTVSTAARRGLRLFYSDDDDDGTDEDDEKIAVAAAYGISAVFRSPRRKDSLTRAPSPSSSLSTINYSPATADKDRLALDISALKQQYAKLRERQRQAHIILTAACARQPLGPPVPTPAAMNHLLLGKSALLSVRGKRGGPPPGAVPPPANIALKSAPKPHRGRQQLHITPQGQLITASNVEVVSPQTQQQQTANLCGETLHWKDTTQKKQRRGSQQDATIVQSALSVVDEKLQGIRHETTLSREIPVINEPELRTDDTEKQHDTESDDSGSSTSTELCDEPDRLSDFDSEEPTSISDTSSQVLSTGEANVTKLAFPSTADKSGPPTPESLLENNISPLKPPKNTVIPSNSRELIVLDAKPPLISQSEKLTDNSIKVVDTEPSSMQQPLFLLEECEIKPPKQTDEVLVPENILELSVTSPAFVADDTESTVMKETSELTSQTEASPSTDTLPDFKLLSLQTPDIYFTVVDNINKLSISVDSSRATSSRESTSDTELHNPKQSSLEKPGPEIKIDVSDILKQSSSTEEPSPVSSDLFTSFQTSELKMATENSNSDEIILKEKEDTHYCFEVTKSDEHISEDFGMVESDIHFTEQPVTHPSTSEVMHPEDKNEVATSNICAELKSVKVTDYCKQKSALILGITQESHQDICKSLHSPITETLQCLRKTKGISPTSFQCSDFSPTAPNRMLQDDICSTTDRDNTTREICAETNRELKSEIGICTESSALETDSSCVAFSNVEICDSVEDAEQVNTLQDFRNTEDRSACVDDSESVSELLELNQRFQDREQACEVGNIADKGETDIDCAEMSELLEIDQNINLGRRNSERALKIIQENSEILQRILQCQGRRPSKLSDDESNGGTTKSSEADSNLPSIATSSSPENVDMICQQLQAVSDVPKIDSRNSCILAFVSPKDNTSVDLPNEVSSSSPIPSHSLPESEVFLDHLQSDKEMSLKLQSPQCEKEEHVMVTTTEYCDNHCFSAPDMPEEFLKTQNFLKPQQHEKRESLLRSARNFVLSLETTIKKDPRCSLASEVLKPKPETDDVTQVFHPSDEQFQSHSEDRATPNISVHSLHPLSDNVHHKDSRVSRTTELELDRENYSSKIQSGWKRFSGMDSSLGESISSKFPKRYSLEATNCNSYSSYGSKDGKENLKYLESSVKAVTDTKSLTSVKWTDDDDDSDGDFTKDKRSITLERTFNDFQSHTDTCFSKLSNDLPPTSSWCSEKSKLKDDSSPIKSVTDSHNLFSHPSTSSSTYSADLRISKPYTSISRYEYSPTKSRSSEKESSTHYFEHDSSKHRDALSPWYAEDSKTCPSDKFSFISSADRTEVSPIGDYLQKSSCSSNKRLTEDFQNSCHSSAPSAFEFSSGTWNVVHRTTRRDHSRPHSTIITDATPTEILNRSYSSSSIDGYLTRTRPDLPSPSASPDRGQPLSSFKSVHDESSSPAPTETKSSMFNPIRPCEMDIPMQVLATDQYRHSSKSSRRNDSQHKFSIKDLSPPGYSSFPQSRWEKDNPSSSSPPPPIKSENSNETSDSQIFSTESSLVNAPLSATKLGKSPTVSPTRSKDIHVSLPPIKASNIGSPTKSKSKFDPFPPRSTMRQPKELGIKLGLYSTDCVNKNGKIASKKT
ncbi:uncharacterized protein LOC111875612 isoform X3 [Cryptotermes secundus]|uniref:uncharacterized protein LOC111875612 isoform X3 n=1 Tax=Cryptotermes secundus TaxID=105785 RepID=UPI001454C6F7|nr:uncharacterized protein LOC111875612 isoform X3 [Cryptotermes secundus]